jgi:hypothetical protein
MYLLPVKFRDAFFEEGLDTFRTVRTCRCSSATKHFNRSATVFSDGTVYQRLGQFIGAG